MISSTSDLEPRTDPVTPVEHAQPEAVTLSLPEEAVLFRPAVPVGVGVLVLLGSSGRMDVERAALLAEHGAHAMALRWFGGEGQARGVCEIPLEVFVGALDRLEAEGVDRLAIIGLSKGAEAAMLVACIDDRPNLTVAMAPTSVVWANVGPGLDGEVEPYRSSWSYRGEPLPFVSYDDRWIAPETSGPISYRTLYEQSLGLDADATAAAAIPIEQAETDLVLVAGHDDQLWPSVYFAKALAERRLASERQVEVIVHHEAGHAPLFPGQEAPAASVHINRGGSLEADSELGQAAWAAISQRLNLHAPQGAEPTDTHNSE